MRKFINTKAKGTSAERELFHKFWDNNFATIRSAGSGSTKLPSPDLLASNGFKKIAIEIKNINDSKKYFKKKEIEELEKFSEMFGCEPWIGILFEKNQWFFIPTMLLKETENSFKIDLVSCKKIGFEFDEMIK